MTDRIEFADRPLLERLTILANEEGGGHAANALDDAHRLLKEAEAALEVCEVTLRLDGGRMHARGMSVLQNETAYKHVSATLAKLNPSKGGK